jgi:hypothetical protein
VYVVLINLHNDRSRTSLALHLLPYLLTSVLEKDTKRQNCIHEITTEMLRVLKENNQDSVLSVQAIFSLMDTLNSWSAYSAQVSSAADVSVTKEEKAMAKAFCSCIDPLIQAIPKATLSEAAFRIQSYARALRYLEEDSRGQDHPRVQRVDGSNHSLPQLSAATLDRLSLIYAQLESGDSVQGVRQLRGLTGLSSSALNKLLELESGGYSQEALQEYTYLQASASKTSSLTSYMAGNGAGAIDAERVRIERGRLKCLIELGQADTVSPRIQSVYARQQGEEADAWETALLGLGVEASWRLQSWEALEQQLQRVDVGKVPAHDSEDAFQVSIGRLFLGLHQKSRAIVTRELAVARQQIATQLSAACMESYARSYPFLTKLHGKLCINTPHQSLLIRCYRSPARDRERDQSDL